MTGGKEYACRRGVELAVRPARKRVGYAGDNSRASG